MAPQRTAPLICMLLIYIVERRVSVREHIEHVAARLLTLLARSAWL
ncbi:MAG: hypothetical protein AB7P11_10480 [Hydrogenophaga sp.]